MWTPVVCLLIGACLPVLAKGPVGVAMARLDGAYDNHHPRGQQARLTGWGARALAAHHNANEAFPVFAAGALVAMVGEGDPVWIDRLSVGWVAARVAYQGLYLADLAALRSCAWSVAFCCAVGLYLLPLFG